MHKRLLLFILAVTILIGSCSCSAASEASSSVDLSSFTAFAEHTLQADITTTPIAGEGRLAESAIGSYDLNGDGAVDNFSIAFDAERDAFQTEAVIKINNTESKVYFDNAYEVHVIDLDTDDVFKEIAVLDDGPSGDPHFEFFRYTGDEIIEMGNIYSGPSGSCVLLDSHGKLLSTWNMAGFEPEIVFAYHQVDGNQLITVPLDYTACLNKEYMVVADADAWFEEYDTVPKDFEPSFVGMPNTTLKKGEKLTIKDIVIPGDHPYWYSVEFANGKKGALYFWSGD